MESPPSYSTNSEAPLLSEDSGLIITSGSFSSDSFSGWHYISSELQESDYDEKSLSLCESTHTSERMCKDNFNTVKKGPGKVQITAIEPPPQFQDSPSIQRQKNNALITDQEIDDQVQPELILKLESVTLDVPMTYRHTSPSYGRKFRSDQPFDRRQCLNNRFASPRLLHLSPCRGNRPASRSSLSSRLSSSHNSLVTQLQADDSSFITQAISHDTLSAKTSDISDMYNVPFDSDIYAVPIDMVQHNHSNVKHKGKKNQKNNKRRGKSGCQSSAISSTVCLEKCQNFTKEARSSCESHECASKRYSLPGPSTKKISVVCDSEPVRMTLREVRKYLHTLYSSSSDSESRNNISGICSDNVTSRANIESAGRVGLAEASEPVTRNMESTNNNRKPKKNSIEAKNNNKKIKESRSNPKDSVEGDRVKNAIIPKQQKSKKSPVRILSINLKQTFCNLFRFRRSNLPDSNDADEVPQQMESTVPSVVGRALPPLPETSQGVRKSDEDAVTDFATSIQRVKDYGWYWGPLSVKAAERILSNEPDGSFIVRDSSDDHYIFTLTFKLNGLRHVRIEHEQGNFCFGGCTMFKAQTIVEFIENAVETSRSGRYLFFLNLRPALGPVRVQLLYPVSRFKRVQSLQHMCRFAILKVVRRDLVTSLPLPRRLLDYLNAAHYYTELLADT